MTGRPAALSAFALASTARVADSAIAPMRRDTRRAVGVEPDDGGELAGAVMSVIVPRRPWWARPGFLSLRRARTLSGLDPTSWCAHARYGAGATKGSSSTGQSSGLQNRRLGVRVPPALQLTDHRPDPTERCQRSAGERHHE